MRRWLVLAGALIACACSTGPSSATGKAIKDGCDNLKLMAKPDYISTSGPYLIRNDVGYVLRDAQQAKADPKYADLAGGMEIWAERIQSEAQSAIDASTGFYLINDQAAFTVQDDIAKRCDAAGL